MAQRLRSKPARSAMQRVAVVIGGQLKALSVEIEGAVRDPVGVAPDGCAKEVPNRDIAGKVITPKHDIGNSSGTIRNEDGLKRRAIAD